MVARSRTGRSPRLMNSLLVLVLILHGLIHIIGVLLLWEIAEPGEFTYADVFPDPGTFAGYVVGLGWLIAVVAFILAGFLAATGNRAWMAVALPTAVLSIIVTAMSWSTAWAGTVISIMVIAIVLLRAARTRR